MCVSLAIGVIGGGGSGRKTTHHNIFGHDGLFGSRSVLARARLKGEVGWGCTVLYVDGGRRRGPL